MQRPLFVENNILDPRVPTSLWRKAPKSRTLHRTRILHNLEHYLYPRTYVLPHHLPLHVRSVFLVLSQRAISLQKVQAQSLRALLSELSHVRMGFIEVTLQQHPCPSIHIYEIGT